MLSARFLARVAGTIAEGFAVLILTAIPLPPAFAQSTVCGATLHAQPGCGSSNDHFAISARDLRGVANSSQRCEPGGAETIPPAEILRQQDAPTAR